MRVRLVSVTVVMSCALAFSQAADAQPAGAGVSGLVVDTTGAPVEL